jgi:hypothetical protein
MGIDMAVDENKQLMGKLSMRSLAMITQRRNLSFLKQMEV